MAEDSLKNLPSPDPRVVRLKLAAKAKAGEIPNTGCPHPVSAIGQFIDDLPETNRNGRPTNLFECTICHTLLRLVAWTGVEATDG